MVNGLSREYWPAGMHYVFGRVMLAFVVAPAITAGITVLAMIVLESALSRSVDLESARSLQVAPWVLVGSYILALTAGLLAFLALWSLRMRGRIAYAAVGMALGAAFALCVALFGSRDIGFVPIIVMAIHLAMFMLVFRAIAGIRRIDA